MKILVVGGNAAGMTAAGRASRLDPRLEITVLERGAHVSYSICGAPYWIGGEVPRLEELVAYTPAEFRARRGVEVQTGVSVEALEPPRRRVLAVEVSSGRELAFPYDRLLIATGYRPRRLEVPGAELAGIHSLADLGDAARIRDALESARGPALLVGGGLTNAELAESLRRRGLEVTLLDRADRILPGLDPSIALLAEAELERCGVRVWKGTTVRTFFGDPGGRVASVWVEGRVARVPADLVLVDVGAAPNVRLAEAAGIALGSSGAIAVNERLETSLPSVYAAGNCAETRHRVSNRAVASALGTAANKQGRVAGENLAGVPSIFGGVLNTWVVRVFDLCVARTGLSEAEAAEAGFRPAVVEITASARSRYFPGAGRLHLRAIGDRATGRLLGLQAAGDGADKRVDVAAAALWSGMRVAEACQLDLGYAPPYSQVWDPFLIAMNRLLKELQ